MQVPVSSNGGIQHFPLREWVPNPEYDPSLPYQPGTGPWSMSIPREVDWKDVGQFFAVLKLQGLHRGRSAAFFWWKDESTGATYPMFMVDLVDLLRRKSVYLGVAAAHWQPQKRGENYGIRMT